MPLIPDEWIERIKAEVSLVVLAERSGMTLKKVGAELMGRCPFPPHEDSTPSLSINPVTNVFQCFGCGVAGTSIDWVMREKGLQFRPAVELLLRDFFHSAAEELVDRAQRRGTRTSAPELPCPFDFSGSDQEILNEYADHCRALFSASAEPQEYLIKRGLDSGELVSRFKLGYQDRTLGLRLPTPTTKAGLEIRERFKRLGLIRDSGHGSFVGSLIVPTIDLSGNVTGIYARKTRDDLNKNHSSPRHLYLRGDDDDVFNEEAFVSGKEIILTEARIDALSFWRWGFRNVTACRGAGNFSQALLSAFIRHGIERCFIAFDRDERGEAGAKKAADKLMAHGIECFRVLFPKGLDANDVIRKMQPADKTLSLFLRSAEWMGNGRGPRRPRTAAKEEIEAAQAAIERPDVRIDDSRAAAPAQLPSLAAPEAKPEAPAPLVRPEGATEKESEPAAEEEKPVAPATSGLVKLGADEAELLFDDRRYKVRGLKKCLAYGSLRLVVKAEREGVDFSPPSPIAGWHMDTLDLCSHRSRSAFEREAAKELGLRGDVVRFDLGKIVRALESVQEGRIAEAGKPRTKAVTLSQKEIDEATDFLKSGNLLERIVEDLTAWGLVGEATNKLACYIAASSRLLERPLAIIIQSSSAAGKSALMEAILALMPEEQREKYTAVSGKSLFYFDEDVSLSHKILAIVEEEGAERATYPLKILQSEGELVMASTGKDPHTGKLVTKVYRVKGPVMIILTTTAVEIDPELENRCLRLTVDESREQTRRIHELQRHAQTLEGLKAKKEREKIEKLHRNAQRLLRPVKILNPFASKLTFVDDQTRTRRDHQKYLTLIEAIAFLHQHQREIKRVTIDGETVECVEVTLQDIEAANRLASEVLGRTLDELPPQTRRFLHLLHEKVGEETGRLKVERSDLRFSRKDLRRWTGWGDFPVRLHLSRLVELEYLLVHRGSRGQSFVYELLWKGEGIDDRPFVLGLVDVEKLRERAQASDTTRTSMGETGEVDGSLMAHRGAFDGRLSPPPTSPSLNSSAAFPLSAAESPENALIPTPAKTRSYVLRRTLRAPRLNLLRFPPGGDGHRPQAGVAAAPVNGTSGTNGARAH